jgi:hypothetical protein
LRGGQIAPEKSTSLPAAEDGKLGTEERIHQRRGARHWLTVAIGVFIAILALLVMFGLPMFMHW